MNEAQYRALREQMVDALATCSDLHDARVIEAMRRVPRHLFVPEAQAAHAYENRPLPLPHGQTISQPLMVALMLQAATLSGSDNVLEVGAGSGYQAALLAQLAAKVTSIETLPELAAGARVALRAAGASGVSVVDGDGSLGYPASAPYDCILVAAAAPRVPQPLLDQLAPGGRLVVPVGAYYEQALVVMIREKDGTLSRREEGPCSFVPLVGAEGWPHGAANDGA